MNVMIIYVSTKLLMFLTYRIEKKIVKPSQLDTKRNDDYRAAFDVT